MPSVQQRSQPGPPHVPQSSAEPLPAPLVCSTLLPLETLRQLAPMTLADELEAGGTLSFLSPPMETGAADAANATSNATKLPPVDYARLLGTAPKLPEELMSRSLLLSARPAWLSFTAAARGGSLGRGGRGGRGARGGRAGRGARGTASSFAPESGLPMLPRLPPKPPSPKFSPLKVDATVQWLPASKHPRARPWRDESAG
jgi:hypothetical protein